MSILTETEIRRQMQVGKLIVSGDASRARSGAYECVPGKVFATGEKSGKDLAADWTGGAKNRVLAGSSHYCVEPGTMVWVRTLESVRMPKDVCAFWWQTHSLSRKGLMLVNMSMVPPGYEGRLSCLFVNFGSHVIPLDPTSSIAKLVFVRLDRAVERVPPSPDPDQYDRGVHEDALNSPEHFLRLGKLAVDLEKQRTDIVEELRVTSQRERASAVEALASAKNHQIDALKSDSRSYLIKAGGLTAVAAVLALSLLTLAMEWVPWLQTFVSPNLEEKIASQVETEVRNRLLLDIESSEADRAIVESLRREVRRLSSELQRLRREGD